MISSLDKMYKVQEEAISKLHLKEQQYKNQKKKIDLSFNKIQNMQSLEFILRKDNINKNQMGDYNSLKYNLINDLINFLESNFHKLLIENRKEIKNFLGICNKKKFYFVRTLKEFNEKYRCNISPNIKNIDLSGFSTGNIILKELFFIVKPEMNIRELRLRNNKITDGSLLKVIPLHVLKILDLSFNEISDIDFLMEMKSKYLEQIYLNDNRLKIISFLNKIFETMLAKGAKFASLKMITLKNNLFNGQEKEINQLLLLLNKFNIETDIKN